MKELLFLTHRIPYPPNKGDKIRSFNALKYLSGNYRISLAGFIDDTRDWRHVDALQKWCADTYFRPLQARSARLRSLKGFLTGEPLTLPYYYDKSMADWIGKTVNKRSIDKIFVFSSCMAQYVEAKSYKNMRRVIDFVDVDSDKWRQYSSNKSFPLSWFYSREARLLGRYEKNISETFDASLFVSSDEANLFSKISGSSGKVLHYDNGVDWRYFSPGVSYDNPYDNDGPVIVFTGAMDYWANVDAVSWFVEQVFPAVRDEIPSVRFFIVGARPVDAVTRLESYPGVFVTGAVEDIRPYLEYAVLSVAPLRIARGVQNKVLEAMSMNLPVLATSAAAEGIQYENGDDLFVEDDPESMSLRACELLKAPPRTSGGREWVKKRYDWDRNLLRLSAALED